MAALFCTMDIIIIVVAVVVFIIVATCRRKDAI